MAHCIFDSPACLRGRTVAHCPQSIRTFIWSTAEAVHVSGCDEAVAAAAAAAAVVVVVGGGGGGGGIVVYC